VIIRGLRKNGGTSTSGGSGIRNSNPYVNRYGAWGISQEAHSEDHSVDVLTDAGVLLLSVPVSSKEWVKDEEAYTSGRRDLPPEGSRVFVMMPTGNFDGCFVLCSGFVVIDQAQKEAFMEEGKEKIRKGVFPGNWKEEYHYETGTHKIVSPDEMTSLEIDYGTADEEKEAPELHLSLFDQIKADIVSEDSVTLSVFDEITIGHNKDDRASITVFDELELEHVKGETTTIRVFDTEIVIRQGAVSINTKETAIEVDGNATINVKGDASVDTDGDMLLKAGKELRFKGATVKAAGMPDAPSGEGGFCALPFCLATGAAHTTNTIKGAI
jgi:hypothetical protein